MRKIVYVLALMICLSCEDEAHKFIVEDMFFFVEEIASEGFISAVTEIEVGTGSTVEMYVMRNMLGASLYPDQTAKIVVDSEESTAVPGTDFTLSTTTFAFTSDVFSLPFTIETNSTAGKVIVLKLEYGYTDESPVSGRGCDRLTITLKPEDSE